MASETGNLYGIRKPKNTPKELSSSTSLAFTSTLSSLLSTSSGARTTSGRARPSKNKEDIFSKHNRNAKKRAARDLENDSEDDSRGRIGRQDIGGVDESVLHRSKRKLEAKAKIYSRLKRGEHPEGEDDHGLIDFDRKWAEKQAKGDVDSSSDSELDAKDDSNEIVEFEDEYGRTHRGTKTEAARMERRKRNQLLGAEELDRMSARPAMPSKLIYGDTVQVAAFNPDEPVAQKMEELARKRDRSLTPPEMKHYEADKEIRSKGVGFYSFSKEEGTREEEMRSLEQEREETERVRRERESVKQKRKKEIEERKRAIGEKRARRQAETFLDGLGADIGSGGGEKVVD
jgi:hypothetical protein